MNRLPDSDDAKNLPAGRKIPDVGVHILSEHVFCPRAALIALESGEDDGQTEPKLGPRLDGWFDYDAHRFAEELRAGGDALKMWFTLLAPAGLLTFVVWRLVSPFAGIVVSLPVFYLLGRIWDTGTSMFQVWREKRLFDSAPLAEIDLAPVGMVKANWWTLRKAGFDCQKPPDPHRDPDSRLTGRPWRMLIKGTTIRIPVVRKHRGERTWGKQHIVRLAAYCRLIEKCEGADAPFGVLLFANSYDCLIFPYSREAKESLERALAETREFIRIHEEDKYEPKPPTDGRCSGCHLGNPRLLRWGSATVLNGKEIKPHPATGNGGKKFHSTCGDRFTWVPPHKRAVELKIVPRE